MLKIALAQIDPLVGSFDTNVKKILESYERACSSQARFLLTSELGLCGYPPYDLVERPEMLERNEKALQELVRQTRGQKCALIVGHIGASPFPSGRKSQNVASVLEDGKIVFQQAKTLIPNYDIFDEARYFEPAQEIGVWECDGHRIGLAICEDLWENYALSGKQAYARHPSETYGSLNLDLLLSLSSSPYERNKSAKREITHTEISKKLGVPLLYVNQVGATDEVLFDGGSFALNSQGELLGRLPFFENSFGLVTLGPSGLHFEAPESKEREDSTPPPVEILARGLIRGIREYFFRTGFKSALIGLSGGIDSAVVATLAVQALGAQHVFGVAMPSQYSSGHSLEDAEELAHRLGIQFEVRPIKFLYSVASRELSEKRGSLAPLALENLQARLRGVILMTLSNHYSSLVLTTGNKSEIATGYCTLYGDMAGALAPIGDLYKTQVYELAHALNQKFGNPIPKRSIDKVPSAELRPNQTDQDSLPPYPLLDALLEEYLEKATPIPQIEEHLEKKIPGKSGWVRDIIRKVEINEYKRRQAAPILKVSPKAFGIGRRIPIAKRWDV